jgi:hypothetical protein
MFLGLSDEAKQGFKLTASRTQKETGERVWGGVSCINSEEYSDMWMVLMVVFVLNMLIRC